MIVDEPGFPHGASGYRARCRCSICTEGHRAAAAASRGREGSVTALRPVPESQGSDTSTEPSRPVVGPWEAKAEALVDELQVLGAEAELLEVQALTGAKLVDAAVAEGRSHQVAPAYRIMTEALNSLKALAASEQQAAQDDGGAGIPRSLLDDPALAFLRSCNIGWFPKDAAGEFEPVQHVCTLPRGHDGPHSDGS